MSEQALKEAEAHLADVREALMQAKLVLMATRNLPIDGILHGSLMQSDELHRLAITDVDSCKFDYDAAWQQREAARAARTQAIQTHRRRHQDAWVQTHQPELALALEHWQEKLRTAPSDHAYAHAKKEHAAAMMAYQQAVALAPWGTNGNGKTNELGE